MNIAIVGFGLEGESAYEYWSKKGATITICDGDPNKVTPEGIATQLGDGYLKDLGRFDLIVRTAGLNPNKITAVNPDPSIIPKVTTVVEEFLRACPTKHTIGITGTKGKGTTSTITTKMLQAAGKKVFLGGNIGISPFDFLNDVTEDDWVVLELSSFQLSDIKVSTHIAVCTMIVPEHLNWHTDYQDYKDAKANLFRNQTAQDIAIYYGENEDSKYIGTAGPATHIPYYQKPGAVVNDDGTISIDDTTICKTDELKLLGKHNWQNVCAAVTAVWQVTQDVDAMRSILTTFTGLEHRLEFVREVDGVRYYNDSFGTTPETAIVALEAFKAPKVVIFGGASKGVPFDALGPATAANNVRCAILIGATANEIQQALAAANFTDVTPVDGTMDDIVAAAQAAAQPGDIVLLSTACASFGMFTDYKERGNAFKASVQKL